MAAKEFLAKMILGSDIHKDLAIAEKGVLEAKDKYNSAFQEISALEEKNKDLSVSLDASKQEISSLQKEKESIDALLSQLLNDEELGNAKTILEGRLDDRTAQLVSLGDKSCSNKKIFEEISRQLKKLQDEKKSLEDDVNVLSGEVAKLKDTAKLKKEQIADRKKTIDQRKGIRDNLSTLKNKWQESLDDFKTSVADADNQKSLGELKRELKDYERRVNNAIEITIE